MDGIIHVACDLETTGTQAGCCILSVALVPFHTEYPLDFFYERISHRASKDAGFFDETDTLNWWDKQKPDVQEEAFGGDRTPESVADSITHYFKTLGEKKSIYLWGNGKDFDNVILAAFFKKLGKEIPWDFRNNMCYRDLAKCYPMYPFQKPEKPHHAFYDAMAEAKHAALILNGIKMMRIPPQIPGL